MNFKDPDLRLPPGTIIREPGGPCSSFTYLVLSTDRMARLWPSGELDLCTPIPHYNFNAETVIVYQPEVPLKVGDVITHEQFAKLPVGSVVLYKDNFSTFRNVYYIKDDYIGINFAGKGGYGDCTVAELSSKNGTLTLLHLEES